MGKRLTRFLLDVILAVSVLALVGSSPNIVGPPHAFSANNIQLPTLPQRLTYHDFWYYLKLWLHWLVASVPHTIQKEWGSFTNAVGFFQPLPAVDALTITRVQGNARGSAGSSNTITVTQISAPASGDVNIAVIGMWNAGAGSSVSSISQTGVTWTKEVAESGVSGLEIEIWAGVVSSGASASITVNLSGTLSSSNGGAVADVSEYSGLVTSSFLDQTATNSGGTASSGNTGTTGTTSQASELFIGAMFMVGTASGSQSSPLNGFTLLDGAESNATASGWFVSVGYLENIVSSTGTAESGTSFPGNMAWDGAIATFKATTGPPPADFTITASPSSQSIGAGGTASSTLTITFGGGFSSTVSLSVTSGCPSGVTCSVSPTSVSTSGGTSTLTVPTLITTTGTYPVVVTATGGSKTHTVTFTVTVTTPPSFTFNVQSTTTQVIVTVTWVGTGTASVTIAGPGGTPTISESGAVVYNRVSYISGSSPPTNIHRVTFTLSTPPAGVWTAYVSQSGATVTIEVS